MSSMNFLHAVLTCYYSTTYYVLQIKICVCKISIHFLIVYKICKFINRNVLIIKIAGLLNIEDFRKTIFLIE